MKDGKTSYRVAILAYWLIFIISPVAGFWWWRGLTTTNFNIGFALFVLFVLIGEHAFRPWKRLWKIR